MTVEAVQTLVWTALANHWVRAATILVLGLVFVRALAAIAHRRVSVGTSPHWAMVARMVVSYGGAVLVLLAAARALDIDLTALIATAGVATVAVGFAAQTSLGNLIAGLFLLVDRPFEVGDWIELEGREGIVQEITLLSTLVRTFDGILVRVPNEVVLKSTILNYSRYPARRIDVRVGVAYGSDVARARAVLVDALAELPVALLEPAPEVVTRAFLDSAVEIQVRVWVPRPEFVAARTAVIETVHSTLRAEGIEIPFPQLTVWRGDPPT